MGRPSKLTPETAAAIVASIEAGNYPEVAAASVGVRGSTYYGWMERGKAGEAPYAEFSEAVTRARAKAEADMVALVKADAPKNAESARWYLERSAADRWGRRDKLTIETAVNAELDAMLGKLEAALSAEEFERVLAVLAPGNVGAPTAGGESDGAVTTH